MYNYIHQWPADREMGWSHELNGVCHDANNWFFTQNGNLWKFPITHRIADTCKSANVSKGIYKVSTSLHMGDIDHYNGYVFVPISDNSSVRIYRAQNLAFVTEQIIKREDGNKFGSIGWLAINPINGMLYTSDKIASSVTSGSKSRIHIYKIGNLSSSNPLTLHATLVLCDNSKQVLEREHMQGGCFDNDNHLHIVNGYYTGAKQSWANSKGGISVFRVNPYPDKGSNENVYRFDASNQKSGFRYQFNGIGEEPEGITWWDLNKDKRAPGKDGKPMEGTLHVIMLDNAGSGDDDFYFKHYRNILAPIEPLGKISIVDSVNIDSPVKIKLTGVITKLDESARHYQWQRGQYNGDPNGNWENIWGATKNTYTPTAEDKGYHIRLKLTSDQCTGELYSSADYVNSPKITGSAELPSEVRCGEKVTVKLNGELAKVPTDRIEFVWERKGDDDDYWHRYIATGNTYTPTTEDVGKKIRVYVNPMDYITFMDSTEAKVLPKLRRIGRVPANNATPIRTGRKITSKK